MQYNELPMHSGWAFRADADRCRDENRITYERLREVCTRGEAPCGGKTVVKRLAPAYGRDRFAVVCNPRNLDMNHIALFCDRGSLCFGYSMNGPIIEVFND